ncbi:hypothetical protein F5Y16DRAFT_308074 [Xylariaceae sp. FL0255]|nr:hypothetical protein F5Y16DRAFT_308074 [Xylariaceae sp. FL0255]
MPAVDSISYSREATITAISDYYEFLTQLYLPSEFILHPPQSGWPSITQETMAGIGKTDEVINLLRHLPYIEDRHAAHGAAFCTFADWSLEGFGRTSSARILTEGSTWEQVPPHVVGLTNGGRYNPVFLLDTQLGVIHWVDCPDRPRHRPTREQVWGDAVEGVEWQGESATWAVADFFEQLKVEFLSLRFLPTNPVCSEVIDVDAEFGDEGRRLLPVLQDIYRSHGWPDVSQYRKKEALEEVKRVLEENDDPFDL